MVNENFGKYVLGLAILVGLFVLAGEARAEGGDETWAFKLTPSYYVTTHEKDAADINLRANHGPHALWLGYYRRGAAFEQVRTGYEYTAQLSWLQLVPSVQLASHGFAGGSINAQVGGAVYGLIGLGRTNMQDYYNLNFDPNDALTLGFGAHLSPQSNLSLFAVKDNRLHTGQTVSHLVWRHTPDEHQRWTLDLSGKHGRSSIDAPPVSGAAIAVTYDYRDVFVRLAWDKKVNFTPEEQTRMSLGFRF
ncbi:hypothetical protein [Dechloromonas sp. HYN0024]|uniref:hypothetical protein n=1 Tax=Dechloromonas sp. HYN0024 TaxID=2231055 RepID=UPI000E44F7C8|nr:hypothetical protein [Dechloromonas sp. HYN0024]AXS80966.1 hypothetical protein HYN24_13605 [Dechloromonas sp. HYN0024]